MGCSSVSASENVKSVGGTQVCGGLQADHKPMSSWIVTDIRLIRSIHLDEELSPDGT